MGDQIRILVVDDDPGVREYLAAVILRLGHEASIADSGEEALERLDRHSFDLILLDFVLPGMTGLETLEAVRQRRLDLPVVFLSGHGQARNIVRAMREGATDFLRKPFELEELTGAMRDALARDSTIRCPECRGTGRV